MTRSRIEDQFAVEQFLYREARLLDERRWDDWLGLWEPGARYRVPTRTVPQVARGITAMPTTRELTPPGGLWWFDETTEVLALRVQKFRTRKAWAEDPPSLIRRLIANVEVQDGADADRLAVRSNFLLYRSRRHTDVEVLAGRREDVLVRHGETSSFRLGGRLVVLDATVLPASDLAVFF